MVGFTRLSEELPPRDLVTLLNDIFSHFDALVEKYNVEKIRTIGDNYMVAAWRVVEPIVEGREARPFPAATTRELLPDW